MLTGHEIERQIEAGNIEIRDFEARNLNPNSVNLRLAPWIGVFRPRRWYTPWRKPLVWGKENEPDYVTRIPLSGFVIRPGYFYLGSTVEYTRTDTCVPRIDGRSSGGRISLHVHATAGFGDIGFCGTWTLEIYSVVPVIVFPFSEVCQISYEEVKGDIRTRYNGRYQGQSTLTAARAEKDRR